MRPLTMEYLAGFFDGEGNIGIYGGGGTGRTLRAQVTQADGPVALAILTHMRDTWGGSLCRFNKKLRRTAWNYQVGGDSAAALISDLLPHLRLKAEQADLALLWFRGRPSRSRGSNGRMLPRATNDRELADRVAILLKRMKDEPIDVIMQDAADLVEIRHTLRQIVNVKGD